MYDHETTRRADALRPGDRIHHAGDWHTVRTVTSVTTVRAGRWRLDYEADQELTVRPEPARDASAAGGVTHLPAAIARGEPSSA